MTPLRAELHELVDELPEQQVGAVIIDIQNRLPASHKSHERSVSSLREARAKLAGSTNGVYGPDYLSELRSEWPT